MGISVVKATGETEPFSEDKLRVSIQRAGIKRSLQEETLKHVKEKLYPNIPTSEIYKHITEYLGANDSYKGARYSLKQSIMDLGPTGYPFEDFVSEILKKEGYATQVRSILTGKCVSHEVDVIAQKDNKRIMIEAKFHNQSGTRTDVQVSLYTHSRFEDIKDKYNLNEAWLVTNTKVTADALSYALCSGMGIVSWSYPKEGSLRELVEKYNLHPITILTTLSKNQKQQLLENHIVLCKDLTGDVLDLLIDLSLERKKQVLEQAKSLSS